MFFQQNYSTPGPGISPDEPEKTGIARFVQILQIESVTLFKLNLFFLISCIPIVTIPPAVYAMNQVVRMMILDQPVSCFHHYRVAFQKNWKRSYGAFFIVALPLLAAGSGALFYLRAAGGNPLLLLPFAFCFMVFLSVILASTYFYGLLSLGKPLRDCLRPALILGIGRPFRALLAALCSYGLLFAALMEFPLSLAYLLLIGFSLPCLLANFFIRTVLRRYFG